MQKTCVSCGLSKDKSFFWKCSAKADGYNIKCKECSRTYIKKGKCLTNPSWFKKGHECIGGFDTRIKKGQRISKNTEFKKGQTPYNKGVSPTNEVRNKIRIKLKGCEVPLERRIATSIYQKQRVKDGLHNNYKGGISSENNKIRASFEYKIWRESVFKRDNYTCVLCGDKNKLGRGLGITLNADHILPFSTHPDKRFDLSNGRTLCLKCHRETPTYGFKLLINNTL